MPVPKMFAVAAVFALLMGACGDSTGTTTTADAQAATTTAPPVTEAPTTAAPATTVVPLDVATVAPQNYEEFRGQTTACGAEPPAPAEAKTFAQPEDLGLDPTQLVRAKIETSCGDLVVELDPSIAPETVNSFVFLAQQGYFDGTASHRVLPGFVLQAGDPTATGRGNPGYAVPDELPPAGFVYERGVLAMANAGPNTTGSQFFVMLANSGLPPAYSVFGRIVEGEEVLDRISALPLGDRAGGLRVETSVPLETLYLERVVILE
jgi:cyclophilin family peptidyl-prolyl cis-trans isomerase